MHYLHSAALNFHFVVKNARSKWLLIASILEQTKARSSSVLREHIGISHVSLSTQPYIEATKDYLSLLNRCRSASSSSTGAGSLGATASSSASAHASVGAGTATALAVPLSAVELVLMPLLAM